MKFRFVLTLAACAALAGGASAQTRPNTRGTLGTGAAAGGAGGGIFPLPQGVNRITSIDAHNYILAEEGTAQQKVFTAINIRHLYSGGIAALFGGSSVPTESFISPGTGGGGGTGRGGNAGTRGNRVGGQNTTGFTGNNGFPGNQGLNNGGTGFNNGNQGNTGGFGGFGRMSSVGNGFQGTNVAGFASIRPNMGTRLEDTQQ